jgi:hypothetical protein
MKSGTTWQRAKGREQKAKAESKKLNLLKA